MQEANNKSIDFQNAGRTGDSIVSLLQELNQKKPSIAEFARTLGRVKRLALESGFSKPDIKILQARLIQVFFFSRFVKKREEEKNFFKKIQLPSEVFEELERIVPTVPVTNGIEQRNVSIAKGSVVDLWVQENYVAEIKSRFRGVYDYSAHARYAANSGDGNSWDDRFKTDHANFHWDQDLNSLTLIVYMSDVGKDDAPFKIIDDSVGYKQNLYLSAYDRFVTDRKGLDAHPMSDRVGWYIDELPADKITKFIGERGTAIMFNGRHIAHDGGFPNVGGHRIAVFIDCRNFLMGGMQKLLRL
jgi:hypothetical protein